MSNDELFFSDDEALPKQVTPNVGEKKQKKGRGRPAKVVIEKQDKSNKKKAKIQKKYEEQLCMKVKLEQDVQRPTRSKAKDQPAKPQIKLQDSSNSNNNPHPNNYIHIQKGQFFRMYFEYCKQFHHLRPSFQVASNPYLKHVYNKILEDLRHRQFQSKSNSLVFSIRTYVIRQTLQLFKLRERQMVGAKTEIIDLQEIQTRRLRKRNVKQDRRVKLPELPREMSLQDMGNLFKNQQFSTFFKAYVESGEMKRSILKKNYSEVQEFCEEIESISLKHCSLMTKKEDFNSLQKPMMLSEVDLYFQEAISIFTRFCS